MAKLIKIPRRFLVFGSILFGSLLILGMSFYLYIAFLLPLPNLILNSESIGSTKIFDRNGVLLYEVQQPDLGKKSIIPLEKIPKKFVQATLAAEDIHFYEHGGVDFSAIARAIFFNTREQRIVSGGSTITQQLVRNLMGTTMERSYSAKALEALYAIRFSNIYSKDQILELYLNKIYYGNIAYGAESAALDYFGKHIYDLDLAESALLAGLPQAPSAYNPFVFLDRSHQRQKYVLEQMVKNNFISEEESLAAQKEPLKLRRNRVEMKAPHFVYYILNQLDEILGENVIKQGGYSIYTTLDYDMQQEAEQQVDKKIAALSDKHVTNGALLAINPQDGKILAWVGSRNYFDDSIDGAVDMVTSLRQPGSAIKPFNYLLALERGYTPATILNDVAAQFDTASGPYSPKNYDLKYHGPVRLREALASSLNIAAVRVLDFNGVENLIAFLKKFGVDLDQNSDFYGLALTLGGGEVRMLDLVKAYNGIANYGKVFEPTGILRIVDHAEKNIYEWNHPVKIDVLGNYGKEHAYQIIDILKDPLARIKGFGEGSVLELSHEAAVKTGTTRNFRDNWAVGFTPQLLTAVWVGNADATPMFNITGVDGAGPIWHDFMEAMLAGKPNLKFEVPTRIREVEICALSGMLPTELCPDRVYEKFVAGFEQKKLDDFYRQFWLMKDSGKIIGDACVNSVPLALRVLKTVITYPPELQGWAADNASALPAFLPCSLSNLDDSGYTNGAFSQQDGIILIDHPQQNDEFELDKLLPIQNQRIPFRAIVPLGTTEVFYWLDGIELTQIKEAPFKYMWVPKVGVHTLQVRARLANGTELLSEKVEFVVR